MISRIYIDTNGYTAFKPRERAIVGILRSIDQSALNSVVVAELLAGFRGGPLEPKSRDELRVRMKNLV